MDAKSFNICSELFTKYIEQNAIDSITDDDIIKFANSIDEEVLVDNGLNIDKIIELSRHILIYLRTYIKYFAKLENNISQFVKFLSSSDFDEILNDDIYEYFNENEPNTLNYIESLDYDFAIDTHIINNNISSLFEKILYYIDNNLKELHNSGVLDEIFEKISILTSKSDNHLVLKNVDVEKIIPIISNGDYYILNFVSYDLLKEIPNDCLIKILIQGDLSSLLGTFNDDRIKLFIDKLGLKNILSRVDSSELKSRIYKCVDFIGDEDFKYIVSARKLDMIENCDYILNNKELVKKVIKAGYYKIVYYLSPEQLDEDIISFLEENIQPNFDYNIFVNFKVEAFKSKRIFLAFRKIGYAYSSELLLKMMPDCDIAREMVLSCMLDGISTDNLDINLRKYCKRDTESIKYAIDKGYKCSEYTKLLNEKEFIIFIENGQPEVIECKSTFYKPFYLIVRAINCGYKFDFKSSILPISVEELTKLTDYCMQHGHYDIFKWLVVSHQFFVEYYIRGKGWGPGKYRYFFEGIGLLDEVAEYLFLNGKQIGFGLEDWSDIIYSKFDKAIVDSYMKFPDRLYLEKGDLEEFFDANGPTKKLYICYIFDSFRILKGAYNIRVKTIFDNDYYLTVFSDNPEMIQYIEFIKNEFDLLSTVIRSEEDVREYFDANGPTKKLLNYLLSIQNLLTNFNSLYLKYYEDSPEVLRYIAFNQKYGSIFSGFINLDNVKEYFDANGYTENLRLYFKNNKSATGQILLTLAHNNEILNNITMDFVNIFEYYIKEEYFKNCENPDEKYKYLFSMIGPKLLFKLDNANIDKLMSANEKDLDIIFKILKSSSIAVAPSNKVYDNLVLSLVRFKYVQENSEIVNLFPNIRDLIIGMDEKTFQEWLNDDLSSFQAAELSRLVNMIIIGLQYSKKDSLQLVKAIIDCRNYELNSLQRICREYQERFEKDFLEKNKSKILSEFGINTSFDIGDAANKLLYSFGYKDFVYARNKLIEEIKYTTFKDNDFIEKLKMTKSEYDKILLIKEEEFNKIIDSIRSGKKPDEDIKSSFVLFKRFLNVYISTGIESNDKELIYELETIGVKKNYSFVLEELDVLNILNEMDIEIFIDMINKYPELIQSLEKVFQNYFIGRLPKNIGDIFEKEYDISLPGGINNIGQFITRYYQILKQKHDNLKFQGKEVPELSKTKLSFVEIIKFISSTNSETYELRRLFGSREYQDFIANPTMNYADFSRMDRESKLDKIADYLYSVCEVTIPSKDVVISNSNKTKLLNFIVGNRTNSSNICHGERTGACMRVGGVGEGLFVKCLTDKNWFHIRIEDPITHQYISRVSGFRNGNSVYLNQLRETSQPDKYSNKDLQEFIQIYAKSLIEETKNSQYPIENVFINTQYAMEGYEGKVYRLGSTISAGYNLDEVKDLLLKPKIDDIWLDVRTEAILLATANEGEGYAPLKSGSQNTPVYSAVRDKIYGTQSIDKDLEPHKFVGIDITELKEKINRVNAMKQKLAGADYRYDIIDVNFDQSELMDGYASSDWYVYLDSNRKIYYDYIDTNYKNSKIAEEEMLKYVRLLSEKYNIELVGNYGKK